MTALQELTVRKRKFDGSVKYEWPGNVRETGRAEWIAVYHDPRRHRKRLADGWVQEGEQAHLIHYVGLTIPLTVIFAFALDGRFLDAKCDAALPGQRDGMFLDFVDLDLDVVVLPGFQHYVRDQDVFSERSVSMNYTEEAKRAAHQGILHALRLVRRRQFPFDGHAESLARAIAGGTEFGNSLD